MARKSSMRFWPLVSVYSRFVSYVSTGIDSTELLVGTVFFVSFTLLVAKFSVSFFFCDRHGDCFGDR